MGSFQQKGGVLLAFLHGVCSYMYVLLHALLGSGPPLSVPISHTSNIRGGQCLSAVVYVLYFNI